MYASSSFQEGLPFSEKKIILQIMEQNGTDGSSIVIPPVLRKRKTLVFRFKPFLRREKSSEFRSEPFWMRKTLEFRSNAFSEEKKTSEFCYISFLEEKKLGIPFRIIFRREKTSEFLSYQFSLTENTQKSVPNHFLEQKTLEKKKTFVSCFVKLNYLAEFPSIPFSSQLRN
jgi:hypothetical protein